MNALITWETNRAASGQVFYSPTLLGSVYNPLLSNFGYSQESFRFNTPKTKHHMILRDLTPGVAYKYKIRSVAGEYVAVGGDYTMNIPTSVPVIALVLPNGQLAQLGGGTVAGASVSTPLQNTTPASATYLTPSSYTPAPRQPYVPPAPAPTPEPEPVPAPTPTPAANENTSTEGSGGLFGKIKSIFW
ncbi:hypothetical protein N9L26_02720 [Candidatus Pacebacteria bacterium]|nr:hypothetical protein [Candidatus Paceibacterota bacterium]